MTTTALITGAAGGIGRAIATRLITDGWHVVVSDIDAARLEHTAAALGPSALPYVADIADEQGVHDLFAFAAHRHEQLDLVVNNAALLHTGGLSLPEPGPFAEVIRTNVVGSYACSQAAIPLLEHSATPSIVNLTSIAAERALRRNPGYSASKAAISALTRALALDLAPRGIRVNAVAPGMVEADWWAGLGDDEYARRRALVPLGRIGRPDDVADAVAFLASPRAAYITGHVLTVDGGLVAQAFTRTDEELMLP